MGLTVTFVSGPRLAGKSTLIQFMVSRLYSKKPHYLRLVRSGGDKKPPKQSASKLAAFQNAGELGVASARWIQYDADRIFEMLPEALTAIYKTDRFGAVIIEADSEPDLRHAYPYDRRVFVMPVPATIDSVFRNPSEAAHELHKVLDDTAAFAFEMFGLFSESNEGDSHEDRPDMTATQMGTFLNSPLGDELATRIQIQPTYHGLIESDAVVVNDRGEGLPTDSESCLRRLERLLGRVRSLTKRKSELFLANLLKTDSRGVKELAKALKPHCISGK